MDKLEIRRKWRKQDLFSEPPQYDANTGYFSIKFNHGGYFSEEGWSEYVKAHVDYFDYCHQDGVSFESIAEMLRQIEHDMDKVILLWKSSHSSASQSQFNMINGDIAVIDMVASHLSVCSVIEMFVVIKEGEYDIHATNLQEGTMLLLHDDDEDGSSSEGEIVEHVEEDEDVHLQEEDNNIGDDEDIEFVMNPPNSSAADQTKELDNQQEVMGYVFDVDSDYDGSDQLDSLDEDSDLEKERFPKFNPRTDIKDPKFRLKMIFPSFQLLKEAVRIYSIKNRVELSFKKNDLKRLRVKCKQGCPWVLYATPFDNSGRVQIRTYIDEHTCSRGFSSKFATKMWIVYEYLELIRRIPEITIPALQDQIKCDYNIIVKKGKAYKGKQLALSILRGEEEEHFLKLADYGGELRRTNPRSTCLLSLDNLIFKRMFVCLSGCKNGFKSGCRPLISIDGCFLKGRYGGQLLAATAVDPNDCIWPIAYAIVEVESRDSWTWFLQLLGEELEIENSHKWTFVSDRQKGLIQAVNDLFPNSEHRFCVRHLIANFKKLFPGEVMKNTVWAAATSTYMGDFNMHMEKLKALSVDAHLWMEKISAQHWSRSHFRETSKCDMLLNNISECFNRFILDARDKPILTMMEMIRCKLMVRIARKRDQMTRWTGNICPKIVKKMDKIKDESRYCWPIPSGGTQFQVTCRMEQFVVDVAARTCSCRKWQLTGLPCSHACAALAYNNNSVEDFVDECYSISTWKSMYDNIINPIRSMNQWGNENHNPIMPPNSLPPKRGRRQKKRRKEAGEREPKNKMRRSGMIMHCMKCGVAGHNKRKCNNTQQESTQSGVHSSAHTSYIDRPTTCRQGSKDKEKENSYLSTRRNRC